MYIRYPTPDTEEYELYYRWHWYRVLGLPTVLLDDNPAVDTYVSRVSASSSHWRKLRPGKVRDAVTAKAHARAHELASKPWIKQQQKGNHNK